MKAIVSGASGYLGYHLVKELLAEGHIVYAICRKTLGHLEEIEDKSNLKTIISEIDDVDIKIGKEDIDVWYHLAWQGALGKKRAEAVTQISNEILAVKAMHQAKKIGCKRIIYTGTVYENLAEDMLKAPQFYGNSFYCIAKKHTHEMTEQLSKKMDIEYSWVQFCHPVGKYMDTSQLFPTVVNAFKNNESMEFGSCSNYFDIISTEYLASSLRKIGELEAPKTFYYIGSGKPRKLKEYIEEIASLCGFHQKILFGARADDGLVLKKEWFDSRNFAEEKCNDINSVKRLVTDWLRD